MIALLVSLAQAAERCPFTRETWNLHDDDDGCPDGARLDVVVTGVDGEAVAGVGVRIEAPSRREGSREVHVDLPLFVPAHTSTIEVVNNVGGVQGSRPAEAQTGSPWEYTIEATSGRDGVATFRGLRPGVALTVHVEGAADRSVVVPEDGESQAVAVDAGTPPAP